MPRHLRRLDALLASCYGQQTYASFQVISTLSSPRLHGKNARAVSDETTAAGDDAAHRLTGLRIRRQCRIAHLLLHLEAAGLLFWIRGNGFVDVGGHGE
jgi:hypothetical protein